jgi:hypothetical protein
MKLYACSSCGVITNSPPYDNKCNIVYYRYNWTEPNTSDPCSGAYQPIGEVTIETR